MKRDDNLYKYGIVIEYNTNPAIKGYGSAIFLHVWGGENDTTEGCVAVSEEKLLKFLNGLIRRQNRSLLWESKKQQEGFLDESKDCNCHINNYRFVFSAIYAYLHRHG